MIELLVVIIVIGILSGIAIPSFLQYQGRAREAAAQANIRASIQSIELYFSDNATYVGLSYSTLKASYDAGLAPLTFPTAAPLTYCVEATVQGRTYSKNGPSADITKGSC
ncbi:MAG: type IV pilin protein [Gaiellaceae bacterium]